MPRPRIIIHVGIFKTGTSSVQNALWSAVGNPDAGVYYPKSGLLMSEPDVGFRHSLLCYLYKDKRTMWRNIVKDLLAEIGTRPADIPVVLSAEGWAHIATHDGLRDLVSALRANHFEEIECICYLRNRGKYAVSLYREFTRRRSNTMPFEDYSRTNKKLLNFTLLAESLNEIFSGNVSYRVYDRAHDIVSDFFQAVGIDYTHTTANANRSISALDAECWRLANAHGRAMPYATAEDLLSRYDIKIASHLFHEYTDKEMFHARPNYIEELGVLTKLDRGDLDLLCKEKQEGRDTIFGIEVLSPLLSALLDKEFEQAPT